MNVYKITSENGTITRITADKHEYSNRGFYWLYNKRGEVIASIPWTKFIIEITYQEDLR